MKNRSVLFRSPTAIVDQRFSCSAATVLRSCFRATRRRSSRFELFAFFSIRFDSIQWRRCVTRARAPVLNVCTGEEVAFFNLGSTVVLVFESPTFAFSVKNGDKVQLGQMIGRVVDE